MYMFVEPHLPNDMSVTYYALALSYYTITCTCLLSHMYMFVEPHLPNDMSVTYYALALSYYTITCTCLLSHTSQMTCLSLTMH